MNRLSATFSYCLRASHRSKVVVWNKKKNHCLFDAFLLILKQYTYNKILTIWKFTSTNHFHTFFGKSSTQQQVLIEGYNIALLRFKLFPLGFRSYMNLNKWSVSIIKNQSCLDSLLNQRKGSCFLKVSIQSPLLNKRKGSCYSKVSIQSLCSIKERVHTIQRCQFSLFAQSKKGSMLFKEFYINKDGCVFNVTFQKKILAFVSKNF